MFRAESVYFLTSLWHLIDVTFPLWTFLVPTVTSTCPHSPQHFQNSVEAENCLKQCHYTFKKSASSAKHCEKWQGLQISHNGTVHNDIDLSHQWGELYVNVKRNTEQLSPDARCCLCYALVLQVCHFATTLAKENMLNRHHDLLFL